MNTKNESIPNLQVVNIGSKKKPLHVIKGFIELQCWNGYYLYDDSYKLKKNKVVIGGRIDFWVDGEIGPQNNMHFSDEQIQAYQYLVDHQHQVKQSILHGLIEGFPQLLADEYSSWEEENSDFPKLEELTPEFDFQQYIGPESISIREDVKDGAAYVHWRFRCRWDPEHGLEFITHNDRVIDIAPEADPWKIYKDNDTYEKEMQAYNDSKHFIKPTKQKKWWQFWK